MVKKRRIKIRSAAHLEKEDNMGKYNSASWKLLMAIAAMRRWWSHFRWGIEIGIHGSMLPKLRKGKCVDVLRRGQCIEIRDHSDKSTPFIIRLIPYQPNHGIMVEYVSTGGTVGWRTHCDSRMFLKMGMLNMLNCEHNAKKSLK